MGRVRRQWPWVVVLAVIVIGLIFIAFNSVPERPNFWRVGAIMIGSVMIVAGIFRGTLKEPGILVVRPQKWLDLCFYFFLGISILTLAILRPG
jgi:hypothetical protein